MYKFTLAMARLIEQKESLRYDEACRMQKIFTESDNEEVEIETYPQEDLNAIVKTQFTLLDSLRKTLNVDVRKRGLANSVRFSIVQSAANEVFLALEEDLVIIQEEDLGGMRSTELVGNTKQVREATKEIKESLNRLKTSIFKYKTVTNHMVDQFDRGLSPQMKEIQESAVEEIHKFLNTRIK